VQNMKYAENKDAMAFGVKVSRYGWEMQFVIGRN
jgi:hypothetical protein